MRERGREGEMADTKCEPSAEHERSLDPKKNNRVEYPQLYTNHTRHLVCTENRPEKPGLGD